MFNRTLTQQLIQRGAHLELTIVGTPQARARARRRRTPEGDGRLRAHGLASAGAIAATVVAAAAERWVGLDDVSMVFLLAVLLVAARTRMSAAMLAALLCFVSYIYFFIEPRYTFVIGAWRGVATVLVFLFAALVAGRLASRLRAQVHALRAATVHATALQDLSRRLAAAADAGEVMRAGRDAMQRALAADVVLRLEGADGEHSEGPALDDKARAAADWTLRQRHASGRYTDTLTASSWWILPLQQERGIAALRFGPEVERLGDAQRRLAEAMVDEIAQALQRTRLVRDLEDARIDSETERLRSALLSSVSHDLRSPLASIIGAAGSLESFDAQLGHEDRAALLDTIRKEGERLDRYIQNLLDMTRLGHGGLTLRRDWIGVDELIGAAVSRLQRYRPDARFVATVQPGLAPLWVHPALIEQALFNVLENAAKFSPPGEAVAIDASERAQDGVCIDVTDRGPGIPETERRRIFDMFYSVERGDRGREGTGLGLTICRGMVGAHGGSVEALPGPDGRGTTLRLLLPRLAPDAAEAA